jgi:Arc/MetJ-type ribon-helix-helix transcriptional regulator
MESMLHIRIDKRMKDEMNNIIEKELFINTTEFIRDAIRKNIENYKTKYAKILLEENFRSFEGKRPNKQERIKVSNKLFKLKKLT